MAIVYADDNVGIIRMNLRANLPDLKVDQINQSIVPGIYEIISGRRVFYVDSTGRYAFLGNLVDLNTKISLTEEKVKQITVVNWKQLPLQIALRQVIGNGESSIAIFTDPDCPFCKRLEQDTIPKLKNVTVYYFLFPLKMHAGSELDAKKILCAENPDKTFLDWMIDGKVLPIKSLCNNAAKLTQMKTVGTKVAGVEVTPTIVLPNGQVVTGLLPADYLNKLIIETSKGLPKNKIESAPINKIKESATK